MQLSRVISDHSGRQQHCDGSIAAHRLCGALLGLHHQHLLHPYNCCVIRHCQPQERVVPEAKMRMRKRRRPQVVPHQCSPPLSLHQESRTWLRLAVAECLRKSESHLQMMETGQRCSGSAVFHSQVPRAMGEVDAFWGELRHWPLRLLYGCQHPCHHRLWRLAWPDPQTFCCHWHYHPQKSQQLLVEVAASLPSQAPAAWCNSLSVSPMLWQSPLH